MINDGMRNPWNGLKILRFLRHLCWWHIRHIGGQPSLKVIKNFSNFHNITWIHYSHDSFQKMVNYWLSIKLTNDKVSLLFEYSTEEVTNDDRFLGWWKNITGRNYLMARSYPNLPLSGGSQGSSKIGPVSSNYKFIRSIMGHLRK